VYPSNYFLHPSPIFHAPAKCLLIPLLPPLILPNIHPHTLQLPPRLLNLRLQLLIRLRHIIKRKHAPAKLKQQICAKRHEGPERELCGLVRSSGMWLEFGGTHDGHDFGLDFAGEGDDLCEECEVDLAFGVVLVCVLCWLFGRKGGCSVRR